VKKISIITVGLLFLFSAVSVLAGSGKLRVPRVVYTAPDNDSVVDLTGKEHLLFKWKGVPRPGGGREAFRFTLNKGFSYEAIVTKDLDRATFSLELPADMFENGATYSWHVKQRDRRNRLWSRFDYWSFKVIKR